MLLIAGLLTTGRGIVMREHATSNQMDRGPTDLPACLGKILQDESGDKWRCDNFHGAAGEEKQCEERYESDGARFWQCKAIARSSSGSFNCLTHTPCDPTKESPVVAEDPAASSD